MRGGGVFDRACKVWRWSGLDLSLPRGGLGRLLPSHEGARECSCHSSGTRSTLFRALESVFLQMRGAQILEARPQNAHEPLMGI